MLKEATVIAAVLRAAGEHEPHSAQHEVGS
jgi:hypothetical protein